MPKNKDARICTAVNKNGQPCRAWAIHDSQPALCSCHAGRTVGSGAKPGNHNALKHGLYATKQQSEYRRLYEQFADQTPYEHLVEIRDLLLQLADNVTGHDLSPKELNAIMPPLISTVRLVTALTRHMKAKENEELT